MGLIILTTLLCLAHLSAATCPQYRPLTADQLCTTNAQCPSGKSCCAYSGSSFCVSTDPNTCITDGKIVKKGQMITLNDSCTTCDCHGYDDLICTDDGCIWPKEVPTMEDDMPASTCPQYRPLNARQPCRTNAQCPSGKSCCAYSGSSFCVSTDPNTCISDGKIVKKGQMITLKDNCTTCDCRGYDDLICTDDACFWPKEVPNMEDDMPAATCPQYRPLNARQSCRTKSQCPSGKSCCAYSGASFCVSTDPNTCITDGKIVKKGQMITLKDNCTTCDCRGYDDLICTDDACFWPKEVPNMEDDMLASTCPQYRPVTARQSCRTNAQCPSGKSCCAYSGSSFCVSTDPNTCISDGKIVKKGQMITLKDNCTTCDCRGYDDLICTDDACYWPKEVPTMEDDMPAATCPQYRPVTARQSCRTNADCRSGKSCCAYSGSSYCVFTNPNACPFDGKIVKKGNSVLLKDNCTTCDCRGYGDLICTNDGCYWPKEVPNMETAQVCPQSKPNTAIERCTRSNSCSAGYTCCKYFDGNFCTYADPNTCLHNGRSIARGTKMTRNGGCSQCICQGHDSIVCTVDGCYWPLGKGCNYDGQFRPHGAAFDSTDGCNQCTCREGRVHCTQDGCYHFGRRPVRKTIQNRK